MAAVSAAPRPSMPPRLALRAHLFSSASPLPMRALPLLRSRFRSLTTAYAVKQDTALWTPAPVSAISAATDDGSVSLIAVDLSDATDLVDSYTNPGQYLLIRVPGEELKPAYMVISSPPKAGPRFEFLVKSVPGATAGRLCALRDGDVVELGAVTGKGFPLDRINPPDVAQTVLIFAAGTGIRLSTFEERLSNWESTGIKIIPVLSQPDDSWKGERGYVQDAFFRNKNIVNPSSTGAILCGPNEMQEELTLSLVADGVSRDKILTNY
ncbi:FAD/NAD(P)-binding oxidoreductase [Zea mays]|uniref:FAD/NAD(P)-binding oxidoreductase n=1 Tax=Zea mays TaxID=4577 RepID=A0A1D6H8S5_MAIZE|nr:FAD/NAD(P)-binding oxidoreductase [Zea mays]